jgi:hypothetical protein
MLTEHSMHCQQTRMQLLTQLLSCPHTLACRTNMLARTAQQAQQGWHQLVGYLWSQVPLLHTV